MKEFGGDEIKDLESDWTTSTSGHFRISVVVATFNRRHSLSGLLESLSKQTLSSTSFELIIVSDGSTDGTVEMVRELKLRWKDLTLVEVNRLGPGGARNAGCRMARGRYLAFTDDDCLAAPDWLEQLCGAFERTGAVAVQGLTTTDRMARTPLTHQMEILSPMLTSLPTCNAGYRRDVFNAVGGFDESFRYAHDEDADLAWRAEEIGKIVFAPEVQVQHPPRRDRFWKRAGWLRGLESEFLLFHKNPDKYHKYVSPSPWWTIYWNVFVIGQIDWVKSSCRYLVKPFRPDYFLVGMGLLLARWFNLVRYFPDYLKAQRFYSSEVAARRVKAHSPATSP
jgi:GT2 family glycosyltransferase